MMKKALATMFNFDSMIKTQAIVIGASITASYALLLVLDINPFNSLYGFLFFNIALALLPWLFSALLLSFRSKQPWWVYAGVLISWVLFLPNTFYVLTDIVHLVYLSDLDTIAQEDLTFFTHDRSIDILLDGAVVIMAIWTAWLIGILSLKHVYTWLETYYKKTHRAWIISSVILACSIAIYLGRYPRWNSWEVFTKPQALVSDAVDLASSPLSNEEAFVLIPVMFLTISIVFWSVMALSNAFPDNKS